MVTLDDDWKLNVKIPPSVLMSGLLSLSTIYMMTMDYAAPNKTVANNHFGFEGHDFRGVLFFVAFLSFAMFMFSVILRDKPKELPKDKDEAKKVIAEEEKAKSINTAIVTAVNTRHPAPSTRLWFSDKDERNAIVNAQVEQTKQLLNKQDVAKNAIAADPTHANRAVDVAAMQNSIKNDVAFNLWSKAVKLAAGRRMQAASLAVDADPKDVAMVEEANLLATKMINNINKLMLADPEKSLTKARMEAEASILTNYNPQHPTKQPAPDNTLAAAIKEEVSRKYWTEAVLLSAGRISAARSVGMKPDMSDVVMVREADKKGRMVYGRVWKEMNSTAKSELGSVTYYVNRSSLAVDSQIAAEAFGPQALEFAVQEKVKQHVWTSDPELSYALDRVNNDKQKTLDADRKRVDHANERMNSVMDQLSTMVKHPADVTDKKYEEAESIVNAMRKDKIEMYKGKATAVSKSKISDQVK